MSRLNEGTTNKYTAPVSKAKVKTKPTKRAGLSKRIAVGPVALTGVKFNPKFDPRILSMPMLQATRNNAGTKISTKFQRGQIVREDGTFGVNFLYNPSVINVSHSADSESGILPSTVLDPDNIGVFNVPLQSTLSFETLFDRTFELWDRSYNATEVGRYGAAVDVAAFYAICGMTYNTLSDWKAGGGTVSTPNDIIASPMQMYPVRVMLGGAYALAYNAWITGLEVQWQHWTQDMVPARCRVAVSMQLLPRQIAQTTASELAGRHTTDQHTEHASGGSSNSSRSLDQTLQALDPRGYQILNGG